MELVDQTLTWIAREIAAGRASPSLVVSTYLRQIKELDPQLGAYVEVFGQAAHRAAHASESKLRAGIPPGLLEGVPIAIKDLLDVDGAATRCGSTIYADRPVSTLTATVVRRLQAAGAVVIGKAHLVEMAYGGWGTNADLGTPRNPWDQRVHRVPGGSSSGCAVAVAAGLAAGAVGTDTGGSVRIPSALCGLTGLKTTSGRVSRHGLSMLSCTLDTIGPMARTAQDAALLLQVMHGKDPADPQTIDIPLQNFVDELDAPIRGVRFALPDPATWGWIQPEVQCAVQHVREVLRALGCVQEDELAVPLDLRSCQQASGVIISREAFLNHGRQLTGTAATAGGAARARVLRGQEVSPAHYAMALQERARHIARFSANFDHLELLVLPTVGMAAPELADIDEDDSAPSLFTRFVGYYGLCAIALPAGHTAGGLPVSVQLVAGALQEGLLLRVAAAFQTVTEHHQRRPPRRTSPEAG
jgi:aspartyl-tRNA(Asn)/glutamyl-tRNA(Gln) amidotransferase subunit A